MAWIESHQSLGRHPKTKAAARGLGITRVQLVGHLQYLWWWALDYAEYGDLSGVDPVDIAEEAMWEGDPDQFLSVLTEAGFLTDDRHINDWDDYTGRLVAQREQNRQRQRRHRERSRDVTPPSHDAGQPVTVTSPLRHGATVPYRTQPDTTVPEDLPPESPRPAPTAGAADAARLAPPSSSAPAGGSPASRTPKQQASDRQHERRTALYAAWCRGVGLDPDSEEAGIGRPLAFRALKPIVDAAVPTAPEFEACTRYLRSQEWRDDPPTVPQVIAGYSRWVAQGRPERAEPRLTTMPGRASPGHRSGGMTPEEIAEKAREYRAQGH